MKKVSLALSICAAVIAWAPAANAADVITISGSSGTFGNSDVPCAGVGPCAFTSMFSFITPIGYNLTSATISSTMTGSDPVTNIDFSSVTLNGTNFNIISSGVVEFRDLLNESLVLGANNTILVKGSSGGNASFAGALSFAAQSAVPEPATWALMLIGFCVIGYSMRHRRDTSPRSYQMI